MLEDYDIKQIFDGIPEDEIPDNRPKALINPDIHQIVAGAFSLNYFDVLFPFDPERIDNIQIIYRQLNRTCLVKEPSYIYPRRDYFTVEVKLSAEETALFANTLLDTDAQVRVVYLDKSVYTDIFKMKVLPILKGKEVQDDTER